MATAYITLMMVIVHYLFDHDETSNPVDRVVIDGAGKLWKALISDRSKPLEKWSEAIEAAVLMFSDQQLVTGIGILVSGYTQINCALSTYHWQIVVYLAWFSSLTHLTTLTALRTFFRDQLTLAYWRVFFMGCTIILLATALAPTGYVVEAVTVDIFSEASISPPISCLFSTAKFNDAYESIFSYGLEPFNWLFILVSLLFLLVSYVSRVISLFASTADKAQFMLITWPGYKLKKAILITIRNSKTCDNITTRVLWTSLSFILMTIYVLLKITFEIGQSMLWEVGCLSLNPKMK
jgi:hypothetical protein